jgi:hypothetical protein
LSDSTVSRQAANSTLIAAPSPRAERAWQPFHQF